MKCLICNTKEAVKHPSLGWLSCENCRVKAKKSTLPYEFTPESVKKSRREYWKDIIQSSRDGVLSKERLDAYGTKGLKVTPQQIKDAKYTWNDAESKPYKEGNPNLI